MSTDPPGDVVVAAEDNRLRGAVGPFRAAAGTQQAGEFLTSEVRLREALANAPSDWQKKNFQAVLHTSIIGQSPGPPKVVTVHFW